MLSVSLACFYKGTEILLGKSTSPEALGSLESTHEQTCFKDAHMQVKHMYQKYFHS